LLEGEKSNLLSEPIIKKNEIRHIKNQWLDIVFEGRNKARGL
jgi:hypothetical protein